MRRGKNQVLYKYLPGKPIDFNQGNAIALVERWFSSQVKNDINKRRIVNEVFNLLRTFPQTRGFPRVADPNAFELLTPLYVEADLFPLTFTCDACGKAYSFGSVQQMIRVLRRHKCFCGGDLSQMDLIYTHECGHIWGPKVAPCKDHKYENVKLNKHGSNSPKEWRWDCGVCGKEITNLNNWCPACKKGSQIYPRPFRQTSVFTPHSHTLVNLQDIDEKRIYEDNLFKKLVLAEYLNLYGKYGTTFDQCLKASPEEDKVLNNLITDLKSKNMSDEMITSVLTSMNKVNPNHLETQNKLVDEVTTLIKPVNGDISGAALKVYEFMETLKKSTQVSLPRIVQNARKIEHPNLTKIEKFPARMSQIGIQNAYVLTDLSIVNFVYGFTRGSAPKEGKKDERVLNRFAPDKTTEQGEVPIYLNKSNTEAILLEFDRWKIVKWLKENGIIDELPPNTEHDLKAWFLNKVEPERISHFSEIGDEAKITKAVYKLIHSITHALVITGSVECGLDKNSLSEMILPSIPAIIIYCSNASSFQTGGMFTLFENNIIPWIDKTLDRVQECIYDPVCMDGDSACHACLHLSEISCEHFNHDLGRDFLVGKKQGSINITGFWDKKFIESIR